MMWQWLSNSRRCCAWPADTENAAAALPASTARRVRRIASLLRFLERLAERVCGIDAEDAQLLGEERQRLQRKHQPAVVRMALDVGVELCGEEIALDHVAFELGHVDAVGGEPAERLVERGWHVLHPEHESRDDFALAVRRPFL